ncbi:MAG: ATP-binding cassette domain-containing protein [Crocinitomicaceae bacterium]|nr:ATP-binding cassette domain-containing protein [Crocinitomicaceae bacterium]
MNITLDNIMPTPLASIQHGSDSIWGNKIELRKGKRILLNASSGKGKSTFTTTAIGLRKDYTGILSYDGQDIQNLTPDDWAEIRQRKISVVFQDLQLFPKLTVRENLLIKNALTDTFTERELMDMLEKLEIENKWEQHCGLLSMGQQQRVAIIRAMAQPYQWLIMDEPFSHLDVDNSNRCLEIIHNRTVEQGAGFVLTTLGNDHGYAYDQELKL